MKPQFAFKFAHSSTALKDIHEVRFQGKQSNVNLRQGKPLHAFHTQGMQIVGVPPELIDLVGTQTIASLNGGVNFADVGKTPKFFAGGDAGVPVDPRHRLITSVHLELPEASDLVEQLVDYVERKQIERPELGLTTLLDEIDRGIRRKGWEVGESEFDWIVVRLRERLGASI